MSEGEKLLIAGNLAKACNAMSDAYSLDLNSHDANLYRAHQEKIIGDIKALACFVGYSLEQAKEKDWLRYKAVAK